MRMDSFEINKIAGAVLATLLFVMGVNILAGVVFTPRKAGNAGYDLPAAEEAAAAGAPAQAQEQPLPVRLAAADPAKGQASARKCASCHDFTKGGPNKIGPNLYGVVGRPVAAHEGFNFSAALKAKGGNWTPEDLDAFILAPKKHVPGTTMAFAGVGPGGERADLIAYMNTLSDNPAPLPKQ